MTNNQRIKTLDIPIIDKVFGMEGGWVLNFVNRSFSEFFHEELGVNIDDPRWSTTTQGDSKAKRLRSFLRQSDQKTALATLTALWEYREASGIIADYPDLDDKVRVAFFKVIERLGGEPPNQTPPEHSAPLVTEEAAASLAARLLDVSTLAPHPRGYAFEKFLKDFFDAYGLSARASFRLAGEQIDGSLVLGDQTYLLEAKWTNTPTDAATLRSFNGKVEDKAKWSRGLFVSQSGFTVEGLAAFGRGKSVICVDGLDLHDILSRRLDFAAVLALKVRRAAETGEPFIRVRNLSFPGNT